MSVATTYAHAPHLLNLEQDPSTGRWQLASTWCNLGLWPPPGATEVPSCSFRRACEALALSLGEAAGLARGDAVLDVGVGYADQTAVWTTHFGVRRVVAVEPSAAHVAAAREAQSSGQLAGKGVVELCVGSADRLDDVLRRCGERGGRGAGGDEPAEEDAARAAAFDAVLCLDCAYHFGSRAAFLRAAARAMRPGGRFAAVDLVIGEEEDAADDNSAGADGAARRFRRFWRSLWRSVARRVVAAACDIPAANLHGMRTYEAALEAAGLRLTSVQILTPRVLAPFATHATHQRRALGKELSISQATFLRVISALFCFVAWARLFEVVCVRAVREEEGSFVCGG